MCLQLRRCRACGGLIGAGSIHEICRCINTKLDIDPILTEDFKKLGEIQKKRSEKRKK